MRLDLCCSGNSHDDMLLAKLETVYTCSGDPGASMVSQFPFALRFFLLHFNHYLTFRVMLNRHIAVCLEHGSGDPCVSRMASFQQSKWSC